MHGDQSPIHTQQYCYAYNKGSIIVGGLVDSVETIISSVVDCGYYSVLTSCYVIDVHDEHKDQVIPTLMKPKSAVESHIGMVLKYIQRQSKTDLGS